MVNNRILNMMGEVIGIADVMFATTAANSNSPNQLNGSITLNLGVAESGEMQSQQAELWSVPGIISVPVLPTQATNNTDAAQVLYYNHPDQNIAFAMRDTRSQSIAGNINPGETCVYAPGGQARVLLKNDGTINMVTTSDNTPNGTNMQFSFGPAGWYVVMPWGKLSFDQAGFRVSNSSGASFNLMSTSDPTTGNAIMMSAGSCTINSGMIVLGTPVTTSVPLPVVYGVIPVAAPGIPILGEGVGTVVVNAAASTSVFVGI